MGRSWSAKDIPDQTGRVAVVTGANSGIGLATARELARKGARVVLGCRNRARGEAAAEDIRRHVSAADVVFLPLDLADVTQVREFAGAFADQFDRLDLLVNNAGLMMPPEGRTKQGFELQFGVNHLGHFALTGLLLDRLLATRGARVVNVASMAHRLGHMDFDDLDFEKRGYNAGQAYAQSKLSNLLFTRELAKKLAAAGTNVVVAAAHPGWTRTNLQQHSFFRMLNPVFGMKPLDGALPTLRAATDPEVRPDDYYGPKRFMEMNGPPVEVGRSQAAQSDADAARLWAVSEERSGVVALS